MPGASPQRHSVSVSAAVVDPSGKLLAALRRDNGQWEPPGGILELEEAIDEGLRREVLEETGLNVEIDTLTGVYKNLSQGIIALVFRCHSIGGQLTTGDETAALRWMTLAEIKDLMDEAYAVRLTDALTDGPPHIRLHDGTALLAGPRR